MEERKYQAVNQSQKGKGLVLHKCPDSILFWKSGNPEMVQIWYKHKYTKHPDPFDEGIPAKQGHLVDGGWIKNVIYIADEHS